MKNIWNKQKITKPVASRLIALFSDYPDQVQTFWPRKRHIYWTEEHCKKEIRDVIENKPYFDCEAAFNICAMTSRIVSFVKRAVVTENHDALSKKENDTLLLPESIHKLIHDFDTSMFITRV